MQEINKINSNISIKLESLNINNKREIELSKDIVCTDSQKNDISLEIGVLNNQELFFKNMFLAKLCLNLENFEDSLRYVDDMAKLKESEFSIEERELFVNSYKSFISQKRSAWRSIYKKENKFVEEKNKYSNIISEIKTKFEEIIFKANEKLIYIINTYIFPKIKSIDGKTFFLKVKADHYRYMAEISIGAELKSYRQNSYKFYKEAFSSSLMLNPLNTIRLGVALNYSVFFFEVLSNTMQSIMIATSSLNEALKELKMYDEESLQDEKLKDALDIIKLIKDNVHHWAKGDLVQENE